MRFGRLKRIRVNFHLAKDTFWNIVIVLEVLAIIGLIVCGL